MSSLWRLPPDRDRQRREPLAVEAGETVAARQDGGSGALPRLQLLPPRSQRLELIEWNTDATVKVSVSCFARDSGEVSLPFPQLLAHV